MRRSHLGQGLKSGLRYKDFAAYQDARRNVRENAAFFVAAAVTDDAAQ